MKYDEVIQLAKDIHEDGLFRFVAAIEAAAVAAEREACAQMCEAYMAEGIGREMARALRARGA